MFRMFCIASLSFALLPAVVQSSAQCVPSGDQSCAESSDIQAQALLQKKHVVKSHSSLVLEQGSKVASNVNPSGAAAPLDEDGYAAVADRCCQAEMVEFISRQVLNLGFEVCGETENGLRGIAPFHSCEKGPQTFDKLTSNLIQDSADRCRWLAPTGTCTEKPADCPKFTTAPIPPDCACSRSRAARLDMFSSTVSHSNLGGVGPDTGVEELRYSNAGTSADGVPFDMVVTAVGGTDGKNGAYTGHGSTNGKNGKFGQINIKCNDKPSIFAGPSDFTFSFVVPATNTPVVLEEVHFAIFDLDGVDTGGGWEFASSKGYKGYVTDGTPSVVASRLPGAGTQFTSSKEKRNIRNPTDPDNLDSEQRRNSVMYFYSGVSTFQITFGIEDCKHERNLFFSGTSALNDRCGP